MFHNAPLVACVCGINGLRALAGGPHISFGHHANLNPCCVRRLLRIAHFLKCGASGNDQWRLVRPDCRPSSKKQNAPKLFRVGTFVNSPSPKSAQKYHANNANRPSVQNCTISKYVHRSRPTRPLSQNPHSTHHAVEARITLQRLSFVTATRGRTECVENGH